MTKPKPTIATQPEENKKFKKFSNLQVPTDQSIPQTERLSIPENLEITESPRTKQGHRFKKEAFHKVKDGPVEIDPKKAIKINPIKLSSNPLYARMAKRSQSIQKKQINKSLFTDPSIAHINSTINTYFQKEEQLNFKEIIQLESTQNTQFLKSKPNSHASENKLVHHDQNTQIALMELENHQTHSPVMVSPNIYKESEGIKILEKIEDYIRHESQQQEN